MRGGGWAGIRHSVGLAAMLGPALVAATVGLVSGASGLDAHQREGGDLAYAIAFLAWALVICIGIAGWTRTAVQIAGRIDLSARVLRLEAWLSVAVATTTAVMSTATIVWWVALGNAARWFLAGRPAGESGPVLAPQLLLAAVVMVTPTLLGGFASRRARRARRALPVIAGGRGSEGRR